MRWLCYPFALSVALALSISAAMLIGRAQPLPERVALLHLNDICKLPCWIGITPGVTTYDQALAIVRRVYGDRITFDNCSLDICIIDRKSKQDIFQIGFSVNTVVNVNLDASIVGVIMIQQDKQSSDDYIRMGDMYDRIGAPDYSVDMGYAHLYTRLGEAHYIDTTYNTIVVLHSSGPPVLIPQWQMSGMLIR